MSIGQDIKEVLQEVGTHASIPSRGVTGEYLVYELNAQVTKPFIREFFLESELPFDSNIEVGDVVEFDDGRSFLVMNKTPEQFENTTHLYGAVFYKTNIDDGKIWRPSGEGGWDENYRRLPEWINVVSGEKFLITESLYGHDLETDEELAQFGLERHELYIRDSVGIKVLDRVEYVSGEFYKVESIKTRRFPGIDVVELAEDTRK